MKTREDYNFSISFYRTGLVDHPSRYWYHEFDVHVQLLANIPADLRCSLFHRRGAAPAAPRIPKISIVTRSI